MCAPGIAMIIWYDCTFNNPFLTLSHTHSARVASVLVHVRTLTHGLVRLPCWSHIWCCHCNGIGPIILHKLEYRIIEYYKFYCLEKFFYRILRTSLTRDKIYPIVCSTVTRKKRISYKSNSYYPIKNYRILRTLIIGTIMYRLLETPITRNG